MKLKLSRHGIKKRFRRRREKIKKTIRKIKKRLRAFSLRRIFRDRRGRSLAYVKKLEERRSVVLLRLRGSIDSATIPVIDDNLRARIRGSLNKHILIDFYEVDHVDSATLATLIYLLDQLKKNNRKLGIVNINRALKNYLAIEKINKLVRVYKSEKDALKELT